MTEVNEKRGGRPPKADKMSNHQVYVFMPSAKDVELLKEAANDVALPLSAWARSILLREAQKAHEERVVRTARLHQAKSLLPNM
ncbi:MAG TPA: hypothetical protein VJ183_11395 [Chloroflexia bacterium]|nr:hypothetical protein [Chloroflexia bacterium]